MYVCVVEREGRDLAVRPARPIVRHFLGQSVMVMPDYVI